MAGVATTQRPRRHGAAAARLALAAALLSAGAAAIHAVAAGAHFDHYVPFGILFVATALLQAAWAVGLLVAPSPRLLAAGAAGNAGVVAAWALSRTAGLPAGPDAWTAEPVTLLDGTATAFEVAIVAASGMLLHARVSELAAFEVRRFAAAGAVAIAGLTAVPLAVAGGGHDHDRGHGHETAAHAASGHVHTAVAAQQTLARPRANRERAVPSKPRATAVPRRTAPTPAHGRASHAHDHSTHPHEHP